MRRIGALHGVALLLTLGWPAGAAAQGRGEHAGFIVRLGTDTIAVEQFVRTRDRLEGEIALRTPSARRLHYVAWLDSTGTVARFVATLRPLNGGAAGPLQVTVEFGRDTADVASTQGDSTRHTRYAAPRGTVPLAPYSHALVEQAIRQARVRRADSLAFDWLPLGAPRTSPSFVVRRGKDSVAVGYLGAAMRARTDKRGRLLGLDGAATTQKVLVTRVREVNVGAFATAFASEEATHGPMGPLSPRDTVLASVGTVHLLVDYGRPRKRGRLTFGGVVPWGQVWRTGANAATQLTTDADLRLGDSILPAGRYTLWTVLRPEGGTLIVNRQTGQWGTTYDASQDLLHLPLRSEPLNPPAEQFTIAVDPRPGGVLLRLSWDTASYVISLAAGP
jgi:hypothetical protein